MMDLFYNFKTFRYDKTNERWETKFDPNDYKRPIKLKFDLISSKDNKKVLKKGSKINFIIAKKLFDEGLKNILFTSDFFIGKYVKGDLSNKSNNEVFLKSASPILQEDLDKILEYNIGTLEIADIDPINKGSYLIDTLNIDKNNTKEDAINDI